MNTKLLKLCTNAFCHKTKGLGPRNLEDPLDQNREKIILEQNPRIQKSIKKSSFVSVTLIFIFWRIPGEDFFLGFRVKILQRKIHRRKLSKKGKLAQYLLSDAWFIADMGLEILAASFLRNFCTCFSCLYRILHLKTHVRFYCRLAVS